MASPSPILLLVGVIALLFLILYLSFLPVAIRQCRQVDILKTSAALTGIALMLAMLGTMLQDITPRIIRSCATNLAFIYLQYRFGRTMLKLSNKRAIIAVCICIGIIICLIAGIIFMLHQSGFRH